MIQSNSVCPLIPTLLLVALGSGCSSGGGPEPVEEGTGPVYAVMSQIYGVDDRFVYVALTDTLDLDELSLDGAREFSGVANFEAVGGRLLISDGEQPLITQFKISDDLRWIEGPSVSFADFPLEDNANFFYQYIVDEHHMYMPFDVSKRIVWDPTDLVIGEVMEDSKLELERDGLRLEVGGNRSGIRYDGPSMQPFFYRDQDWYRFGPTSPIAVYDPQTHQETAIVEAPCPGLAVASGDEEGGTWFSSWDYSPVHALYGQGPPPCIARIGPDRTLDPEATADLTELTGGRYSVNFRYVRDGWGLADVLHHEEMGVDFSGEPDPDVLDQIWAGGHWRVWRIDLARGEAAPFDDIDVPGGGWSAASVDGRTFLFVPYDLGARTRIYELDAEGAATELLDIEGDAFWMRVR